MDNNEKEKDNFLSKLKKETKKFYKKDEITPLEGYSIEYPDNNEYYIENDNIKFYLRNKYVLDLLNIFGYYEKEYNYFKGLISTWNEELTKNYHKAKDSMDQIQTSLGNILSNHGKNRINELSKNFDDLGITIEQLYKKRLKVSNQLNEETKEICKLVLFSFFSLLIILCILLAALLLCLHKNFCKSRCGNLAGIHIIWNILALLMIASLFFRTLIAYKGLTSIDMINVLSYIVSKGYYDNAIIQEFGRGSGIIFESFKDGGNLSKYANLDYLKDDLNRINKAKIEIQEYLETFKYISNNLPAYKGLKSILENKTEFINDTYLYYYSSNTRSFDTVNKIELFKIMKLLNNSIDNNNDEKWDLYQGDKNFTCTNGYNEVGTPINNLLHPWTCEPIDRDWVESSNKHIKNYAKIASDIINLLKFANGTKDPGIEGFQNYYDILDELKVAYEQYLKSYIDSLEYINDSIAEIIEILERENLNNDGIFPFLDL